MAEKEVEENLMKQIAQDSIRLAGFTPFLKTTDQKLDLSIALSLLTQASNLAEKGFNDKAKKLRAFARRLAEKSKRN